MLLRFRMANHRSIRDEATLSLVSSSMRGTTPPQGDWRAATLRVAGIYGANASGKSTVLHALDHCVSIVRNSATAWAEHDRLPHTPFALAAEYRTTPSLYELDFTVDGVRYTFGFRALPAGVEEEWLYSYPTGRRRLLYERTGQDFEFGRHLPGENVRIGKVTRPTSLFLSSAANNRHPFLSPIHHYISRRLRFARLNEPDRTERLQWVVGLMEDNDARRTAEGLLRFADFGVNGIELYDEPIPDELREALRAFMGSLRSATAAGEPAKNVEEVLAISERQLQFIHDGQDGEADARLTVSQESSGTVAWLCLAVPALDAIRKGEAFVVDEIDSSLHPSLTSKLISMFKDPETNKRGAQLIFTSHDTSLLGRLHGKLLSPEEVWLTEKASNGATELYSAAEFSVRARDNLERRYLQGRYGAVPIFSRSELRQALGAERVAS